jgi:mannose-6-phosphate isomerase-like protein (cupin superfamily)
MDTSRQLGQQLDAIAPDTMEVRLLAQGAAGSMAHFLLAADHAGVAVVHPELEEIWYCLAGEGLMWLSEDGDRAEVPM